MSGLHEDATFTLKAVINKKKNKVLFVEIENDLANLLLVFMILPLGRVVQALKNHYGEGTPVIGSLSTLYDGLTNLDSSHFKSFGTEEVLMDITCYPELVKASRSNFFEYSASFIVADDLLMVTNVNVSLVESLDYIGVAMADLDGAETVIVTFGFNEV